MEDIHEACSRCDLYAVNRLIKNGADVNANKDGESPLYISLLITDLNCNIAKLLLKHGADPNYMCTSGYSILSTAVYRRKLFFTKLLLEYGADINLENAVGGTPFDIFLNDDHAGRSYGYRHSNTYVEMLSLLLKYGANVNNKNNRGDTLLHKIHTENTFMVHNSTKLLLEHGARVNDENNDGDTPLHMAAHSVPNYYIYNFEIIKMLLDHGAHICKKNNNKETPYDIVKKHNMYNGYVDYLRIETNKRLYIASLIIQRDVFKQYILYMFKKAI